MAEISALHLAIAGFLLLVTTAFLRFLYILPSVTSRPQTSKSASQTAHMIIVLGSGGHTAEMMSILRGTDTKRYFHRTYIVSSGDNFSAGKALEIERMMQEENSTDKRTEPSKPGEIDRETGAWDVKIVPRARKIHQPLYTAPFSSLWCLIGCLRALEEITKTSRATPNVYPDVIVTNGPATAVIMILATFVLKFFGFAPRDSMRAIYVESWARVKTLSLSGKVLLHLGICHLFLVQWEALANGINGTGKRASQRVKWKGFLVE